MLIVYLDEHGGTRLSYDTCVFLSHTGFILHTRTFRVRFLCGGLKYIPKLLQYPYNSIVQSVATQHTFLS
jgi:hypothetical protein